MVGSITLRVKWSKKTARRFSPEGFDIPWNESELLKIQCPQQALTIEFICTWIEARVEGLYFQQTRGQAQGQAQIAAIWRAGSPSSSFPWGDHADQHLKDGDTVVVDCQLVTEPVISKPEISEDDLKKIRATLRFDLNDRVVCFCGPRWFSGLVVGSAVPHEGDVLPYLVKTDPLPGMPTRTISVPSDTDEICTQEICFDPRSQLQLVKAAAQLVKESARPTLRFAVGDKVAVRIRNRADDGLEQWVAGTVTSTWPKLHGKLTWQVGDVTGKFPDTVPYRVDLSNGSWVFCHRDHFTLIRREGMQPQTRVKGISKRMEVIIAADGSKEKIDHQTERRKRLQEDLEGEDSD